MLQQATLQDVETIVEHRWAMFRDMGHGDEAALQMMATAFRPWLCQKMEEGEYLAWFVTGPDGTVAAGLGLWLMDWPPHMVGPGSRRGNILNVYTRPECRRQGMARALMQTALAWCGANGIRAVILHASDEGRALYQKLGFQATNEMRIMLG
ncbi:GCN5-related N-acetyltransferase [Candidatus Sulfopaludibacter sp. SbA3]|nr:GCN5-related N-acetyltransferase [Candidatus Sulfopaludibacter sp. SbA3]